MPRVRSKINLDLSGRVLSIVNGQAAQLCDGR